MIIKKTPLLFLIFLLVSFLHSCEKKKTPSTKDITHSPEVLRIKNIADQFLAENKYDSSFFYYNKLKKISETLKDTSAIINSINGMAEIQISLGDHSTSEETAIEALPYIENTDKYPYGKTNIYNSLGRNYLCTFDYNNALFYFSKALKIKTDPIENACIATNIALTYIEIGDYQKSTKFLLPLIKKQEILNNPKIYAMIINNLGYCYFKIGNPKGIDYLIQSMNIKMKFKDDYGLLYSYYYLTKYYQKINHTLAMNYAILDYKTATKLKNPNDRIEILRYLIKNNTGNESKKYALIYLNLNDSIQKVRQKAKNQFAKIKYDFNKEKEENEILKSQRALEQEKQKNKNLFFYFIIITGLLSTLFIYYYLTTKNKKEKIKASYNTEVRIAKKLHDELANDVYHTMAFAETQDLSSNSNKEKLLYNLDTIYTRTRNISKENSAIDTEILFVPNLKEMLLGFNTDKVNILANALDSIKWEDIASFKKIAIYRVLQELLVNMKKHSKSSLVVLTFEEKNNQIVIKYTDNGIGATKEQLVSKNGLKNVENRILAINGIITFENNDKKGFRANINFPL